MGGPLELLFPPVCAFCDRGLQRDFDGVALCQACRDQFESFTGPVCLQCASPIVSSANVPNQCAYCRSRAYAFASAVSLGPYRGKLREAVLRAKRPAHEALAAALGTLLAESCRRRWPHGAPHFVVPLPMHWMRRFSRGANGVERLAESVARGLHCPCHLDLLAYTRGTAKQGTLSPSERFTNVRGALRSTQFGWLRASLKQKTILLVDDVMTTGATASEAARALRRAGAAEVRVAVVARGTGSP